jgi:hypothetical protein
MLDVQAQAKDCCAASFICGYQTRSPETPLAAFLFFKAENTMKKHPLKTVALFSLFLFLAACAASGQLYSPQVLTSPSKNKAQLVIYRPSAFTASVSITNVEINGMPACELPNSSFFKFDAEPGQTTVSASIWGGIGTSKLTLKTKAGSRYFIRVAPNTGKILGGSVAGLISVGVAEAVSDNAGSFIITAIDKETAQQEIVGRKQSLSCQQ